LRSPDAVGPQGCISASVCSKLALGAASGIKLAGVWFGAFTALQGSDMNNIIYIVGVVVVVLIVLWFFGFA
jgi:hypothetical protein